MKKSHWKSAASTVLTVLVIAAALFLVFRDNYKEILANLRQVTPFQTAFLFLLAAAYQAAEAGIGAQLIRARLPGYTYRQSLDVTFLGVFGNVATFAVGSIPMQSYRLYQYGLDVGSGVGMMTMEYVFHKTSILLYATVMLLSQAAWLGSTCPDLAPYLIAGYGICILVIIVLILLCTWEKMKALALWLIQKLPSGEKWDRKKSSWTENLESLYTESQNVLKDRARCARIFLFNILKLFCLYTAVYCSFRFLGIDALSPWRVQLLSSLMLMISSALPNVAGVGPAEFTFLLLFSRFMEPAQASTALILYRTATYFFPFILSAVVMLISRRRRQAAAA